MSNNRPVLDYIPEGWFSSPQVDRVRQVVYRMATISEKDWLGRGTIIDIAGIRVVLDFASLTYQGGARAVFDDQKNSVYVKGKPEVFKTGRAAWLILLIPCDENDSSLHGSLGVNSLAGIFSTICGRNTVYEKEFEQVLSIREDKISVATNVVENPNVFPKPNLSSGSLALLVRAIEQIEKLPTLERNRIELSLHWLESSLRSQGLDTFIKAWIALEILAMPDGTNIKPINDFLADVYGMSSAEAHHTFLVGKIFGLRGRILHKGELLPLTFVVEEYLYAIFIDVLLAILELPSEGRSQSFLVRNHEKLMQLVSTV